MARPGRPGVYNSYTNIYAPYPWRACPWLFSSDIPKQIIIKEWGKFHNFAVEMINEGYYIISYFDRYNLPNLESYHLEHHGHDTMIYGYDIEKGIFYTADLFNKKYGTREFYFSDIEYNNEICDDFYGVLIIKPKECEYYHFSLSRYQKNIVNFLKSSTDDILPSYGYKEHNFIYPDQYVYGLRIFQNLYSYLDTKEKNHDFDLDIRGFHLLYDYSNVILYTANFISDFLNIDIKTACSYSDNTELALCLRNIIMLIQNKGDFKRFSIAKNKLKELEYRITQYYKTLCLLNIGHL